MKKLISVLLALVLCMGAALAEDSVPQGALRSAAMRDYNGLWHAVMVDMDGMQLTTQELGMSMQLMVDSGWVTLTEGEGVPPAEGMAAVEAGALVIALDGSDQEIRMYLLEDGRMVMPQQESGMYIYFEKDRKNR